MSNDVSASSTGQTTDSYFKITEIPFPLSGRFPFEARFTKCSLNSQLRCEIEKVEDFIKHSDVYRARAEEYLLALQNRLSQNEFLLQKKIHKDSHFSPTQCVKMKDIEGLKLIVANRWGNINEQDARGRAPIHFASSGNDAELFRVLLLHEDIETQLKTKSGKSPVDMAASPQILRMLQLVPS